MTKTKKGKTTKVSFVDKEHERFNCVIKITYRNGYKELSISSDNGQHKFIPANEPQERLLQLWDTYHLNGMKAGTPAQELALSSKEFEAFRVQYRKQAEEAQSAYDELMIDRRVPGKPYNVHRHLEWEKKKKAAIKAGRPDGDSHYACSVAFLRKMGLYSVPHPETGESYEYGSEWLRLNLPADIDEQIKTVVSEIVAAEVARKGENLNELTDQELLELIADKTSFIGRDAELAAAFVRMFALGEGDLDDIKIDGTNCRVQGIYYIAGDDDEMLIAVIEEIRNSLWAFNPSFLASKTGLSTLVFEALQPQCENSNDAIESLVESKGGIEPFVESAVAADGRAHFLNRYDGNELSVNINGTTYYAYRQ